MARKGTSRINGRKAVRASLQTLGKRTDEDLVDRYYNEYVSYTDEEGFLKERPSIKLYNTLLGEGTQSTVRAAWRVKSKSPSREEFIRVRAHQSMHLEGVPITVKNLEEHMEQAREELDNKGDRWCMDKLQEFFDERGLFAPSSHGDPNCAVLISKTVGTRSSDPHATEIEGADAIQTREKRLELTVGMYHPHGVFLLDQFTAANGHIIRIVDLVPNITPYSELCEKLTEKQKIHVGVQAAEYLSFLCERGVIHRDIKPSNVLVTIDVDGQPYVRVADLGLMGLEAPTKRVTMTGDLLGTPDYMSPEQARRPRSATSKSDVYSLGATLYTLLTGKNPNASVAEQDVFSRWHNARTREKKVTRLQPGQPKIAPLETVLSCMMFPDEACRYDTTQALEDLRALYDDQTLVHAPQVIHSSPYSEHSYFSKVFSLEGETLTRDWTPAIKIAVPLTVGGAIIAGAVYGPSLVRAISRMFE